MKPTKEIVTESVSEKSSTCSCLGIKDTFLLTAEIILILLRAWLEVAISLFRLFVPASEKPVNGEIVLITGAGRGIGKELAVQYAALGATVVCWGITKDKNEETVAEIARLGYPKAYFYPCDVSNYNSVMETAKKVQEEVGDVTILVNNAGIAHVKPFLEHTHSEIEKTLNVNLMSQFWTVQAFLPAMLKNNHGHIMANSSIGGLVGLKNGLSYCASKFAIKGMMEALYRELQCDPKCRIKLTTIYPYLVKTDIFKRVDIRFPKLMPILDAKSVAKTMITAQRRDVFELSIPKYLFVLNSITRMFPLSVAVMVLNMLNVSVEE